MRGYESVLKNGTGTGFSATTSVGMLKGGKYAVSVVATFGGGTVKFQKIGPDGSTVIAIKETFEKADGTGGTGDDLEIGSFAANGQKILDLPPGVYQFTVATASAIFAEVVRIPGE